MPCCSIPNRAGDWFFPDLTRVPIQGSATTFYRNRGDHGAVNLNRLNNNVMMPIGRFCCEVPDAIHVPQRLCVAIGKLLWSKILSTQMRT